LCEILIVGYLTSILAQYSAHPLSKSRITCPRGHEEHRFDQ
jgi:hypothetical protein